MDPQEEAAIDMDLVIDEVRKELKRRIELMAHCGSPRSVRLWLDGVNRRAEELAQLLSERYEIPDESTVNHRDERRVSF